MSDPIFNLPKVKDQFANLDVNVGNVYIKYPINRMDSLSSIYAEGIENYLFRFYSNQFVPLKLRIQIWQLAFRAGLDQVWFREFSQYWTRVLKGRPLWGIHDFYFLKNLYRMRFQTISVPNTSDSNVHLGAWQKPELLYQLMHLLTKETTTPDAWLLKKILRLAPKSDTPRWLEFGCATAPITNTLFKFWKIPITHKIFIADIRTLAFHYAAFNFRNKHQVVPIILEAENDFQLNIGEDLEVIFCIQVFEHLMDPLQTIKAFEKLLRPGGLLVFDYIKTDASGLDTFQGVEERVQVLDFIRTHFSLVDHQDLDDHKSLDLTIAIKQ